MEIEREEELWKEGIQVESFHHQPEREERKEFVWEFKRWLKSCCVKRREKGDQLNE